MKWVGQWQLTQPYFITVILIIDWQAALGNPKPNKLQNCVERTVTVQYCNLRAMRRARDATAKRFSLSRPLISSAAFPLFSPTFRPADVPFAHSTGRNRACLLV